MSALGPTATLPPLGRLLSIPGHTIQLALRNLRSVYFPHQPSPIFAPKTGLFASKSSSRKGDETPFIDSGYASAEEEDDTIAGRISLTPVDFPPPETDDEALELIRDNAFERAFAIKWLSGFIARAEMWIADVEESSDEGVLRCDLLEESSAILSSFICEEEDGEVDLTRSFTFPTSKTGESPPIHVELNDAPISSDDHTSVGLQSWGSCILFAEKLCSSKETYLSDPRPVRDRARPLRILELGAGTGMLSIVIAKLLETMDPAPEIIATDYHPDVLANLSNNVDTNFSSSLRRNPVLVDVLDWECPTDNAPFDRPFDVILAADVVYHPDHARWIEACVSKLLSRSEEGGDGGGGVFWMFMAIRGSGRHEGLDKTVDAMFVHREALSRVDGGGNGRDRRRLVLLEQEDVQRQGGIGRADENGYKLSKIGWA